jgi:hypothetical protein
MSNTNKYFQSIEELHGDIYLINIIHMKTSSYHNKKQGVYVASMVNGASQTNISLTSHSKGFV